ncbi:hypothetical protein DPMN_138927, partial [Dreissena polymorpha]
GPVFFTQELNVAEYINYGASKPLLCCASGFHSIQWHILNKGAAWDPYPPDSTGTEDPQTEEEGQVLRIYHAMNFQNTKFRCDLVVNGSEVLSHTVRLYVSHCSTQARGPILTEPFPQNQTIYDFGGNINFYCTGNFGCYKHNDVQIVMWSVDTIGNNASGISERYHLVTNESEDKTTLRSTLTIEKVEPIDTNRTFICTIMNDQSDHGQTDRSVRITKKEKPMPTIKIIAIAVSTVVGVFIALLLVGFCVKKCWGPQVKLFVYVHCPCSLRKVLDVDKYEFHVFLYHHDDDRGKAETIKKKLEDKYYDVFISADIKPGTEVIPTTSAILEKSAAVHFLYTENLLLDAWAMRFLTTLMEDGKDILCLEIDAFEPQHVITTIEEGQIETDGPVMNGIQIRPVSKDISFWKRLPKVKVPNETDSQRKQNNFWCFLQNKLPKPKRSAMVKANAKRDNVDRRNSERPLLASPPPTPMNVIVTHQEESLASDDVFVSAEIYLHNEVQQQNPQPATIYDGHLDQVKWLDFEHDTAITHEFENALETENERTSIKADNQIHAKTAENFYLNNQILSNHDTSYRGVAPQSKAIDVIHHMSKKGFMSSGDGSTPASVSSPPDNNADLFRSDSYEGSTNGGISAGISGQSDSGYSRSQTSSSFCANSDGLGTSQSSSSTSPLFNGLSSGENLSFTERGEVQNGEAKYNESFVKNDKGLKLALASA